MDLKFIASHNQVAYLAPPPVKHKQLFTSLIKGLSTCRIAHALRENPVVYESLIRDFWKTAKVEIIEGKGAIAAEIDGTKIIVTEQVIRDVLKFNDQETDPIELAAGAIEAILPRLSYEGKFPPLVKKFVHPYWRLLLHMFLLCMTENRGGIDQLNTTQTAALICVITNEPFNYSRYVLEAMKRNAIGLRKDKFLMYPRFVQMILNERYPELKRSGDTLELKPMGPSCFGALTTKKGTEKKFEGLIELEKFGQFAETEDIVENPVMAQAVPTRAIVAEEHDIQRRAENEPEPERITINSDDEGVEITCDSDDDNIELSPEVNADAVSTVNPVISAESLAMLIKKVTDTMGNPPPNLSVSTEEPEESPRDSDSIPLKRKRRDPRSGMFIEQGNDQSVTVADDTEGLYDFDFEKYVDDATTTTTENIFESGVHTQGDDTVVTNVEVQNEAVPNVEAHVEVGPSGIVSAGPSGTIHEEPSSSSGKRPVEPLRMPFDSDSSDDDEFISMREMKKRLVVLEQDSIHKDAKIIQLEDTIVKKDQQIEQLQGDVSLLFNIVYDLRGKLEKKFGQEFSDPTDVENRKKAFEKDNAERSAAMEKYFERVTDPEAEKAKAERLKKKREFVILKNKNANPDDEDARATHHLVDVGETLYDKKGNRSGVVSWGYDHDRNRWWIKRKVGPVEWYKHSGQFQSFTKVDLTDLTNKPYVDDKPNGPGYAFFERLKREVAKGFPSMRTADSTVKPAKGIRDPYTNKRMKIVHWPATDKEKTIPLVRKIPKGALKTMHFWVYDERLGQAVIVCDGDASYCLVDQIDLLNLAVEDLEVLASNQIRATEKYEEIAKGWTSAVASVMHIHKQGFGGYKDNMSGGHRSS
ncbi:hypothetical protein HanHA300_Chr15g0565471 [Helianthus annuus]|nr:hypothetical protein HanHA300_Chr15g0565471 [Helianthus annuus]KAJ0455712.1 hypothetical protein HanIR_Chr15g0754251 [Helianthus annuus]KAJ0473120.1 hypothetical protein HanHA89_Chr15g0614741 [Helianthus annuus]KAJ0648723.1 hypothetical protein HanLR1_Chr15g0576111 [Helianthus annuus]KAJ0652532.1 hypothetical protein HanOQP8_Chr15g0573221 [Helianthus annuus]